MGRRNGTETVFIEEIEGNIPQSEGKKTAPEKEIDMLQVTWSYGRRWDSAPVVLLEL